MSLSQYEIVSEMIADAVDYARVHDISDAEVHEIVLAVLGIDESHL